MLFWGGGVGAFISSCPACSVTVCTLMKSVNEKYCAKLIFNSQHYIPPARCKKAQ